MQYTTIYRGPINTRYCNEEDCEIILTQYAANNRIALLARNADGSALMTMSTNIPEWDVGEDTAIIKDYSENQGVLDFLVKQGIVKFVASVQYGDLVKLHICTLLKKEHVQ